MCVEFINEPYVSRFLFIRSLLITNSTNSNSLVSCYFFRFSMSFWITFHSLVFLGIWSVRFNYLTCIQLFKAFFFNPFQFRKDSSDTLHFSLHFSDSWFLFVFPCSVYLKFCQFCLSLQRNNFGFFL